MRHIRIHMLTATLAAICLLSGSVYAADITVSPTGGDVLHKARDAAKAGDRIVLRGGRYELSEPLVLEAKHSGVTWIAAAGEKPVISGGRLVTGWKDAGDGLWTAAVPETKDGGWALHDLYLDGRRAQRARWPAEGQMATVVSTSVDRLTIKIDRDPGVDFAGQEAELIVVHDWSITRTRIVGNQGAVLTLATPSGWMGHGWTTTHASQRCFIEHARAFLDQPEEWFLDRPKGQLLLRTAADRPPAKMTVMAPRLGRVLILAGESGQPVRDVRFEGLVFEGAAFPLPDIGYPEIQAGHYAASTKSLIQVQPPAIEATWAENCRFEACEIARCDGVGIAFGVGCRRNEVVGCRLGELGGNGVMIGWRGKGRLQRYGPHYPDNMISADWADAADAPTSNRVAHCLIERCGQIGWGSVGIWDAFSAGSRIVHNTLRNLPYSGISIGFRWDSSPTSQRDCLVEGNHIHNVMQSLADGGAIYTLGFQPGTVLRGNLIHDVKRGPFAIGAPNNGFFADEGSKGYLFDANTVCDTTGRPVRHNASSAANHTWSDNDFGGVTNSPAARAWWDKAGPSGEARQRWGLTRSQPIYLLEESEGLLRNEAISLLAGHGTNAAYALGLLYEVGAGADVGLRCAIQDALKRIKPANRPPVAVAGAAAECVEGKSVDIAMSVTDADDPSWCLSAEIAGQPQHGALERKGPLVLVYAPKPGFVGKDSFTWRGSDGQDASEPVACAVEVRPDREGPRIVSVAPVGNTRLVVDFDEPVTEASAARVAAYRLQPAAAIKAAALGKSGRGVTLDTAVLTDGAAYTLTAAGIADRSVAANAADSTHAFTFRAPVPGLSYRYYETDAIVRLISDAAARAPSAAGVAPRFGKEPARHGENYALDFNGVLAVPVAGEYTFFSGSDDGSHLWIDGQMVVDNGGKHGSLEGSGKVSLDAGPHRIRVLFYQGSGNSSLSVRWQGPDIEKREIPAEALSHQPEVPAPGMPASVVNAMDEDGGTRTSNSVVVVTPYRSAGVWVFADPAAGIRREPFVAGMPRMLDILAKDIPNADQGFRFLFSGAPFPGHTHRMEWGRAEEGGHWYYGPPNFGVQGWLGPAFFKYLRTTPRFIYFKAEPK